MEKNEAVGVPLPLRIGITDEGAVGGVYNMRNSMPTWTYGVSERSGDQDSVGGFEYKSVLETAELTNQDFWSE